MASRSPLNDPDQVDHRARAVDRALDRRRAGEVGADDADLADLPERLEEEGLARVALGDAQPRAGLEQRFADVAADEAAAAENGDEGRVAGDGHAGVLALTVVQNRPGPWAKRGCRARGEHARGGDADSAVDRLARRPLSAAPYRQLTT